MAFWEKFRKKSPTAPKVSKTAASKEPAEEKKTRREIVSRVKEETTGDAWKILLSPLVTEKTSMLQGNGHYAFVVARAANKLSVKRAVEKVYGVKPVMVRITNVHGKEVRYGRATGKTAAWKKAVVVLKKGEKIQLFEGV